jgi:hypothetical protein
LNELSARNMLFLIGSDEAALERAARLFPIRSGVTTPDWIVVGANADQLAAGGILAAG